MDNGIGAFGSRIEESGLRIPDDLRQFGDRGMGTGRGARAN
jgi:hypothetical protein